MEMIKTRARFALRPKLVSLAVASCFATGTALANPTGHHVVRGAADIHRVGNLLQITNSPNAIINWQSFSIGANEITRFIQQSSSSAVLNRVTSQNPSSILGALHSNGRVFLINPNGILFGAGSTVDVGGLVASSLKLSNADFVAKRMRFTETPGAKPVINEGSIKTRSGGNVYLVGPDVTNSGIITTPKGEVVLAAGKSVELVDPGTPNLRVEIVADANSAANLGQIVADAGRVGIYAGLVTQSGTVRADSAVAEGGRIMLKATKNATLEAGSVTSANGTKGGSITVESGGTTLVAGTVHAKGSAGKGGTVNLLGHQVGVIGNALINASGAAGGGTVLVGGDFQGKNPEVQNAFRTYLGPDATISADAIKSGDGGKVIVWSDDATRAYGTISARGGAQSGNGGFVEVSGKRWLDFSGRVNTSAAKGSFGTLLLDPSDITIDNGVPTTGSFDGDPFFLNGTLPATISWATIAAQLTNSNAIISTSSVAAEAGNITVAGDSPNLNSSGFLHLVADNKIFVNARITNTGTGFLLLDSANGVEQNASGAITFNQLYADGGTGSVQLNAATNMVNTLAGRATGAFSFKNGKSLTVGSTPQGSGIFAASTSNGPSAININVTSGNLTVNGTSVNASTSLYKGSVNLTAAGSIDVKSFSSVHADGAEGAAVTLSALGGGIAVTSSTINASGGVFGQGANGAIALNAAGDITVDGGEGLFATGGGNVSVNGGSAGIALNAGGGIMVMNNSSISATGAGGISGGSGTATLVAGGGITVSGSTVSASGGAASSGTGGDATVSLTTGGDIALASSVNASSGTGAPAGTARIFLTFLTSTGNFSVNGMPGAIVDPGGGRVGEGFFVDGLPAIPNVNFFVTQGGPPPFTDVLVATMNQQVDVMADQLKAGDTGDGGEDKDKKKLPFCDGG